jgi:phytoene dehydrogenase-like protein
MTGRSADHDVVIVGAGLAGLRAAAVLARRGLDVSVLDAADRPGGRVATDVVDGFRLDRGFQVLNTVYPALRAAVDLAALRLRPFVPGAAIRAGDGALHTFGNPLRRPALAWPTATDGLFGPLAKARLVAWTARVVATPPRRTATRIDRSAARDFAAAHLDGPVVEQLLRPFLSGVLGERDLVTSAAYVRLVWRCFALGTIAVPADGMGALPTLLAEGLPEEKALSTGRRVTRVAPGQVEVDGETVRARAVVVATDPRTAGALLPGLDAPEMRTLTTYHHAAPTPPADAALLHLDGTGGPIANTVVMPESAAPAGRALVSSSVVGPAIPEPEIRRELSRIYGAAIDGWELLRVDEVRDALPAFPAGRPLRSSVELGEGLFVAGDHRDTPSQQGALVSGRRAAEAVLAHLGA